MNTWQNIKAEIDAEVAKTTVEPVQDVTEVFKYRMSKGGAGIPNDNQIFTTWVFGGGDVNYLADYCYFLYELCEKEEYTMEMLVKMMRYWVIQPSTFGLYCGLNRQYEFSQQINEVLDSIDKPAFRALLDSYRAYLGNIYAWVYHYMPWGVGNAFPRKDEAYYQRALELLKQ